MKGNKYAYVYTKFKTQQNIISIKEKLSYLLLHRPFSLVRCVKKGVQPDSYSCGEHVVDFISRACQNRNVDPSTFSFPLVDNPIHLRKKMYEQIARNIGQSVDKLVNELGQIEFSSLTEAEQNQLVRYLASLQSLKNAFILKGDCPLGVALNADNLAVQKVKARLA